jgi:hypothetical protein
MSPPKFLLPIISIFIPALALTLTTYLHKHPLRARIQSHSSLSPSSTTSSSLHTLINPSNHTALSDSYSIRLSPSEIRHRNDEEILAAFTYGFFSGWVFRPEKYVLGFLERWDVRLVALGFES